MDLGRQEVRWERGGRRRRRRVISERLGGRRLAFNKEAQAKNGAEEVTIVCVGVGLHWAPSLHYQGKTDEARKLVTALKYVTPCSSSAIQLKR